VAHGTRCCVSHSSARICKQLWQLFLGDDEREDWIDRDDASALDDESRVPLLSPSDVLNQSAPQNGAIDERRKKASVLF
jgi:hypothetical protein